MCLNCGVGEDSWESLGLQGDPTSPFWKKSILNIHWKDWCWSWNSNTLSTWCEELTREKRPWCWERMRDFTFLGSKITADGDCSHEIKRHLLLRRKAVTNLDSILKSRDITLPAKVHLVKGMVFLVAVYECESWTIKKAEHRRNDALNCGVGEDSWESFGLQGNPTSPF